MLVFERNRKFSQYPSKKDKTGSGLFENALAEIGRAVTTEAAKKSLQKAGTEAGRLTTQKLVERMLHPPTRSAPVKSTPMRRPQNKQERIKSFLQRLQ